MALSLSRHRDAGAMTVAIHGDVDFTTAARLETELLASVTDDVSAVLVDLSDVTFIDSAGISVLLKGRRLADERHKDYRVTGATGVVRQLLDITGVWGHLSGHDR